jgi:hypothetical protein
MRCAALVPVAGLLIVAIRIGGAGDGAHVAIERGELALTRDLAG